MSNPIVNKIMAKVRRAEQHIQDFHLGLRAFYKTEPYRVATKEDTNAGKRIYYLAKMDCAPDALAAIVADVIQNLRSALDHLGCQLVLHERGGSEPDWDVYYPIARSAADYPAMRNGRIKGVRQAIIDAIDATEPYKGGKGHALWQLKELSNPDKHQILIGAYTIAGGIDIAGYVSDLIRIRERPGFEDIQIPHVFLKPAVVLRPMETGDHLFGAPIDHEVTQNQRFAFDIAFHAPGIIECEPELKTLKDFRNLVGGIIHGMASFFESP